MLLMVKLILLFYKEGKFLISRGFPVEKFVDNNILHEILRIKQTINNEDFHLIEDLKNEIILKLRNFSLL